MQPVYIMKAGVKELMKCSVWTCLAKQNLKKELKI